MSGMDRLTEMSDEDLIWQAEQIEKAGWHPNHSQNELARALRELVARRASQAAPAPSDGLRAAAVDLLSWFDEGPSSYGPWIIPAGPQGADDAVFALRAALTPAPAQEVNP